MKPDEIGAMLLMGIAYFAGALFGSWLSPPNGLAMLWPPGGILLLALLRAAPSRRAYLVLATCLANVAFTALQGQPTVIGLAYWSVSVSEAVGAMAILEHVSRGARRLRHPADVLTFAAVAAGSAAVAAVLGSAVTLAWRPETSFVALWRSWWAADLLGLLAIVPVGLTWEAPNRAGPERRMTRESMAFATVLFSAAVATIAAPPSWTAWDLWPLLLGIPLLGWSALRLGVAGTSWAMLVLVLLGVLAHVRGIGTLAGAGGLTHQQAAMLQILLSGLAVTFLTIAAAIQEGRSETAALQRRHEHRNAFVEAMTHEIRGPLGVVLGALDILRSETSSSEPMLLHALGAIDRAARQIVELVEEVLELGRAETAPDRERLWLPALWRDLRSDCEYLPRRADVTLRWDAQAPAVAIATDRRRVVMIVRNLVGNALKFTDCGHVHVQCGVEDGALEIVVEDTGIGITPAAQARVFELYYRDTDGEAGRRRGTGIGLHVVRRYAEQLGGKVTLTSVVGRGSRFAVTLPLEATGVSLVGGSAVARPPSDTRRADV